jgi:hypothetical protein
MPTDVEMAKAWEELEIHTLRLMSFTLDALVEMGVALSPEQYRDALLRAKEWAKQTVWSHQTPPEYAEAMQEAVTTWIARWRAERARLYGNYWLLPEEQ